MTLKIIIEKKKEDSYTIRLEGRLDTDTYLEFEKKVKPLIPLCAKAMIIDMAKLDYISSAGLSVIFSSKKAIEAKKGSFIMINLKPQIRKVFEIVKALPKETVFESMEEADRYLDMMQKKEIEKENPTGT